MAEPCSLAELQEQRAPQTAEGRWRHDQLEQLRDGGIERLSAASDKQAAHLTVKHDALSSTARWRSQALEEVEAFAPQFVLLDVMMPGMGGPETLTRLSERIDLAQVPVVFMTAKVQPSEIEHLRNLGARDVIVKPFDPMRLASQIQAIWEAGGK